MVRQVFLSADPGIDDMAAILFALADPAIELLGIGAVAGNVDMSTALENTQIILSLVAREDVPCYHGSATPLLRSQIFGHHQALGRFAARLQVDTPPQISTRHAALVMAAAIRDSAKKNKPITLVGTGPLTDIALALKIAGAAACAKGIDVIAIMGGAFKALGNRAPYAEMNWFADPHAARIVCESGFPLMVFPLDVTFTCRLTDTDLDEIATKGGTSGEAFVRLFRGSNRENSALYGGPGGPVHDLLPMVWLTAPALFEVSAAQIRVNTGHETPGHAVRLRADTAPDVRANHRIAESVDAPVVRSLFISQMAQLAAVHTHSQKGHA